MNSKKLIKKLWKKFPLKTAKKYHDYVGLMVSKLHDETNKIIVCLDVTPFVVDVAIKENVDLIISHHPFIYGKKRYVLLDPYKNSLYSKLELNNIPVYSFHTNFDESKDGMNDALAVKLGLINIKQPENVMISRIGELEKTMHIDDFVKYVKKAFSLDYLTYIEGEKKYISKVGIIGGSGSSYYQDMYALDIDVFISGDTPYHIRRELQDKNITYINADHEIEKIFLNQMKKVLLNIDSTLNVIEVDDVKQIKLL